MSDFTDSPVPLHLGKDTVLHTLHPTPCSPQRDSENVDRPPEKKRLWENHGSTSPIQSTRRLFFSWGLKQNFYQTPCFSRKSPWQDPQTSSSSSRWQWLVMFRPWLAPPPIHDYWWGRSTSIFVIPDICCYILFYIFIPAFPKVYVKEHQCYTKLTNAM